MSKPYDFQISLNTTHECARQYLGQGKVATYIPALARVPAERFGMAVVTVDGQTAAVGDADEVFSIQSISKVFTLLLAMQLRGAPLWQRVGREPSGTPFNSIVQLEYEKGIPLNPFINAGAHITTDCVVVDAPNPKKIILSALQQLAGNSAIAFDAEVAASEHATGHRNAAIENFLKETII
jgi:glutaminase